MNLNTMTSNTMERLSDEQVVRKQIDNQVSKVVSTASPATLNTSTTDKDTGYNLKVKDSDENIFPLIDEILAADGLLTQDPTTGREIEDSFGDLTEGKKKIVKSYTTNLFGLPFQLLDSVDARFESVNPNVGYEFLRTFIMHSPILHLSPGLPLFTGGVNKTRDFIKNMLYNGGGSSFSKEKGDLWQKVLINGAKTILTNKIQRRMFGIIYKYENYMGYVNLLCRSVALLLKLVTSDGTPSESAEYPHGVFVNSEGSSGNQSSLIFKSFTEVNWGNYRYESNATTYSYKMDQQANELMKIIRNEDTVEKIKKATKDKVSDLSTRFNLVSEVTSAVGKDEESKNAMESVINKLTAFTERTRSVQFVVDPQGASENYRNDLKDSEITQVLSKANSIGSEVAFYTGTNIDAGLVGPIITAAGKLSNSVMQALNNASSGITGGFAHNLISGALGALQGERIIFPKIYDKSESSSSYSFKVNLASPYGDIYNYFINIVVPYLHLLALAAPREVSSNASKTPFIVKAFIPGLCTCELGMITNLHVSKNPETQHISANGFPLSVSIEFEIAELYNHLAISTEYDPFAFMFNETLMDYLCNLSGIYPTLNRLAYQTSLALSGWQNLTKTTEGLDPNMINTKIVQQIMSDQIVGTIDLYSNY